MVLGGVGCDRKESPESNLHVCDKDDTKIVVYNMEICIEKGDQGKGLELLYNFIVQQNHMIRTT